VIICHNVLPHEHGWLDSALARWALRRATGLVVHSAADQKTAQDLLPEQRIRTAAFPNYAAFGTNDWSYERARAELQVAGRVLLFFGLVRPYKGLAKLIEDHKLGETVFLKNPDPWDPAAVSAHANAAEVADFLERVLMRKGIDDEGGPLISSINCVRRSGAQEWRNAAWISTQMIYGQRLVDGKLRSYAVARDVVAHEIFHGVTENTARLDYFSESGALNESYSDIFGILISNAGNPDVGTWNSRTRPTHFRALQ